MPGGWPCNRKLGKLLDFQCLIAVVTALSSVYCRHCVFVLTPGVLGSDVLSHGISRLLLFLGLGEGLLWA